MKMRSTLPTACFMVMLGLILVPPTFGGETAKVLASFGTETVYLVSSGEDVALDGSYNVGDKITVINNGSLKVSIKDGAATPALIRIVYPWASGTVVCVSL